MVSPGLAGDAPLALAGAAWVWAWPRPHPVSGVAVLTCTLRHATDTRVSPPCRAWSSGCRGRMPPAGATV